MRKSALLYLTLDHYNLLMRITAEMLAMPERVCRRPRCHRQRACRYVMRQSREAACVSTLGPDMRVTFDALFNIVLWIADYIAQPIPARDQDERALEAAAIEIILASRKSVPGLARRFDEWLALYKAALSSGPAGMVAPVVPAALVALRQQPVQKAEELEKPGLDLSWLEERADDWRAYR